MADFNFITERLATGGALSSADDVTQLVQAGITHVIDCRAEFDDRELLSSHPEITYRYNGTNDDGQPKPTEWFQVSLMFALPALLAIPKAKVYAHCAAGVNRGPSTAFCILRALGLSHLECDALIRLKRPVTIAGIRYADDADRALKELGYP